MRKKYVFFCKAVALATVFSICITIITPVFERKNGAFRKINNLLVESNDSIDFIFLGSSITEGSVDIVCFEEQTGYCAYNIGIQGQPAVFLPIDLQQVVKKQKPRIAVVETYRYIISGPMSVDTAANALGHVGTFRERLDTIGRIELLTSEFDKLELVFPILAAHNRWSQLTEEDLFFDFKLGVVDEYKGYVPLIGNESQELYQEWTDESIPISDYARKDIDKLIEVANKYGITLIFVDYPHVGYSKEDIMKVNGVYDYLEQQKIEYVECHWDKAFIQSIDPLTDYMDSHHPNIYGAEKITDYIADYINQNHPKED